MATEQQALDVVVTMVIIENKLPKILCEKLPFSVGTARAFSLE